MGEMWYTYLLISSLIYIRTSPKRFFVPTNHLIDQPNGILHPLLIAIPMAIVTMNQRITLIIKSVFFITKFKCKVNLGYTLRLSYIFLPIEWRFIRNYAIVQQFWKNTLSNRLLICIYLMKPMGLIFWVRNLFFENESTHSYSNSLLENSS